MDSKKVIGNSVVYTVNSILLKAFGFILLPVYTSLLNTKEYGIVNLVTSFSSVANYIIAFCLFSAIMRFYADYKNDKAKVKRFFGTIIIFVFMSGSVFTLLMFIFKDLVIKLFFKNIDFYPTVVVALMGLTFGCVHIIYEHILKSMEQAKKFSITSICYFFGQLSLNMLFLIVFKMKANGVLLATLIVNVLIIIYMFYDLIKNDLITVCIDSELLKNALAYSVPLLPHNLSSTISSFVSRIFIKNMHTLSSVGLFGLASQFGSITDVIQTSVNTAFQPYFYEQMNKREENFKETIYKLTNALVWVYGFIFIGISLFAQDVILLFINKRYHMAWTVIPLIVITYTIKILYYFYINILFYYKKATKYIFRATLSSSFLNIFLSYLLIPKFDMYGSVMADAISMVLRVGIIIYLSKKFEDIGYNLVSFIKKIVLIIGFIGVGLVFSYTRYVCVFNIWNFIYKIAIFMIYVILCLFIIKKQYRGFYDSIKDRIINKYMKWIYNRKGVSKKAIFICNGGKNYGCNTKAISEKLHKSVNDYEIVWLFKEPNNKKNIVPEYIKCVKIGTFTAYKEMATAKIWVLNGLVKQSVYKGDKQIYIQTWHGDRGFKKILMDLKNRDSIVESKICDLMLVGSEFGKNVAKSAFEYNGIIYDYGCPRNDILVNVTNEEIIRMKNKFNIDINTKILLFAPTFRRNSRENDIYNLNFEKLIEVLEKKTKEKWVIITRYHSETTNIDEKDLSNVINMTKYEDMSELLLVADGLITDYSSCAGDYILREKMLILYQPDYKEYVENEREGYFDIIDSPYLVANSENELCYIIMNTDRDDYVKMARQLKEFYGVNETGKATEEVVKYIESK